MGLRWDSVPNSAKNLRFLPGCGAEPRAYPLKLEIDERLRAVPRSPNAKDGNRQNGQHVKRAAHEKGQAVGELGQRFALFMQQLDGVASAGARHAVGMRQSMPSAALIEVARKISIVMRIKKSVHNTLAT